MTKKARIPLGGMGNGLERAYSEKFLLSAITISVKIYESSWLLYNMKPTSYKLPKIKITVKRETPGGIHMTQKPLSNNKLSSFCYAC